MAIVNVVLLLYALLNIALGVYGYVGPAINPADQAKPSIISLVAGTVMGLLILGSLALAKTNPRAGRIAAAVLTLLMLGKMGMDALAHPKWHTVTLSIASLITLGVLIGAHFYATNQRRRADAQS